MNEFDEFNEVLEAGINPDAETEQVKEAAKHPGFPLLADPSVRKLAHLPILTMVYLHYQKSVSATPVTPLELAAHLGVEVKLAEEVLHTLQKRGLVHPFRDHLDAFYLIKELEEITLKDLVGLLLDFHELGKTIGAEFRPSEDADSQEKYRKIYSELAAEILTLFGQASVNQLPL